MVGDDVGLFESRFEKLDINESTRLRLIFDGVTIDLISNDRKGYIWCRFPAHPLVWTFFGYLPKADVVDTEQMGREEEDGGRSGRKKDAGSVGEDEGRVKR